MSNGTVPTSRKPLDEGGFRLETEAFPLPPITHGFCGAADPHRSSVACDRMAGHDGACSWETFDIARMARQVEEMYQVFMRIKPMIPGA